VHSLQRQPYQSHIDHNCCCEAIKRQCSESGILKTNLQETIAEMSTAISEISTPNICGVLLLRACLGFAVVGFLQARKRNLDKTNTLMSPPQQHRSAATAAA
jgi:hypothetical protein